MVKLCDFVAAKGRPGGPDAGTAAKLWRPRQIFSQIFAARSCRHDPCEFYNKNYKNIA